MQPIGYLKKPEYQFMFHFNQTASLTHSKGSNPLFFDLRVFKVFWFCCCVCSIDNSVCKWYNFSVYFPNLWYLKKKRSLSIHLKNSPVTLKALVWLNFLVTVPLLFCQDKKEKQYFAANPLPGGNYSECFPFSR